MLKALQENQRARIDDFILYGAVLKRLGYDLKNISLYDFLANAKGNAPTFETVTRARRHICELMPELKDGKTAIKREDAEEIFKNYNLTGIGEN